MSHSDQEELIVVIGTGCRFPGGCDSPSKLWDLLKAPRDVLCDIPRDRFDPKAWYHPDNKHHGTSNVRSAYLLDQDPAAFDNGFFNIQSSEAEAVDPQQRILLETVYDSLCEAGCTIEGLRGSNTAVYVGLMCDDWSAIVAKDTEVFPQYAATGTSRSVMSNRVSYFFDWHGPSMTIDTACSSSLVAVHQAIHTLRSGESNVAIAAGANLILSPEMFIAESNLSMLSAAGRSRMWDRDVDGYARGEGIAAVVLKRLSDAVRDNDQIECVIRATSVNQDGKTPGLTMPSGTAQAALIRSTYARAGLDISDPRDRPQFFHAHGTGTAAGDPQEAKAIHEAFYSGTARNTDKLYVGSVKTVIGHTEGTAGLASLISTSLAMRHKTIPPNMHFNNLNPRLKPYYRNLEVPTKAYPWPEPAPGQPRRASVNSFGFGGTNAHAIIEEYLPSQTHEPAGHTSAVSLLTPLVFSASSEASLRSLLSSYLAYLKANPTISLQSFAYTLQARRSTMPHRVAITCNNLSELISAIDAILSGQESSTIAVRQLSKPTPKVLAVFTGQGAQWARMGAKLVETSPFVSKRLKELDEALATSTAGNAPEWTLSEMILAGPALSRVAEAAISQPLCTAVQIVLVDLLRQAGVKIDAVVGHSSGEIGAAYASGLYTARDAIRAAYYRGLYSALAKSPNGGKGSMMAVGTTHQDAIEFCDLETFAGRLQVAAVNSFDSITLSGDADAVAEACEVYQDEGAFARQLKVDTAYHSSHVLPCSKPYLEAMTNAGREALPEAPSDALPWPIWYSSVRDGQEMTREDVQPQYWVDNMTNPVLFSTAVEAACSDKGLFDLIIEIGPHPALQKPCLDTVEETAGARPPYVGLLGRGKDDVSAFSKALGFIWTELGPQSVAFDNVERTASESPAVPRELLKDLPQYPFDHSSKFLSLSRVSGFYNRLQTATHPLLGKRCYDRETNLCIQWRNILSIKEVPWLTGHQIQGLTVFPAAGFVSMAIEAIVTLAKDSSIGLLSLENVNIGRAMAFQDDSSRVEVLFDMRIIAQTRQEIAAEWACYSGDPHDIKTVLTLNASGVVRAMLAENNSSAEPDVLPALDVIDNDDLSPVDTERFYKFLKKLGYNYSWPFYGTKSIRRKAGYTTGMLEDQSGDEWQDQLLVHPGVIDTALQTAFAAFCCPGDERLWSLHVPTSFKSLVINPFFTSRGIGKQRMLQFVSTAAAVKQGKISAELYLLSKHRGQSQTFLQAEGLELVPIAAAVPDNDTVLFSRFDYKLACADGETAAVLDTPLSQDEIDDAINAERVAFYYLYQAVKSVTPVEEASALPHYQQFLSWARNVVENVERGDKKHVLVSATQDSASDIASLLTGFDKHGQVSLSDAIGKNLVNAIRTSSTVFQSEEHNLPAELYAKVFDLDAVSQSLANMVVSISHRYPRMNILEVGSQVGGSTQAILSQLDSAFETYTYTNISDDSFSVAEGHFAAYGDRINFKTLDITQSPASQGFPLGEYDLVVASNVISSVSTITESLTHLRALLKPGGFGVFLEPVGNDCLRLGLALGCMPDRSPLLDLPQWNSLLNEAGFSSADTISPPSHGAVPGVLFCTQAIDDRIKMLRSPLSNISSLPGLEAPQLTIIGRCESSELQKLRGQLSDVLASAFPRITFVDSVEEVTAETVPSTSSVIMLAELDESPWASLNPEKLEGIKNIYRQARHLLWVTTGADSKDPYSNISLGIGRAMQFEYPHLSLQSLDVDVIDENTANIIAEYLLRLQTLSTWKEDPEQPTMLWSMEPEVWIKNKMPIIPRLYPYTPGNDRYNTTRRAVRNQVVPRDTHLALTNDNGAWEVQVTSPLHQVPKLPYATNTKQVRVSGALLSTFGIVPGTMLMLCAGQDTSTGEALLALSPIAETLVQVPSTWTIGIDNAEPRHALGAVAANILARLIAKSAFTDDVLIVHDPHPMVANELVRIADERVFTIHFTTASAQVSLEQGWQHIGSRFSASRVKCLLPINANKLLDLSKSSADGISARILSSLPRGCQVVDMSHVMGNTTELQSWVSEDEVAAMLQQSVTEVLGSDRHRKLVNNVPLVSLESISEPIHQASFAIADCSVPYVTARVRAVDDGIIFHDDKTYLLVGLTGEIGRSLCKWMAERGARHIVLTSRTPKEDVVFSSAMKALGALIKYLPMDVRSRDSIHACYAMIQNTMPPVAGVANGAMILHDMVFDNMPFEVMDKVLAPKVLGSQLLDELFYNTPLDFFIFFSSMTAVLGNSGQANYIAGNMYMNALAAQRKRRGVAGSSINISSVIGVGYVERSDQLDEEYFSNMGYRPMSEQDLQVSFAEAIVLGKPGSSQIAELSTGINSTLNAQSIGKFLKDIKFSHMMMHRSNDTAGTGPGASAAPLKVQLSEAKKVFLARLRRILSIPVDKNINEDVTLVEQGVDSLMAVEVRSFFNKELDVDIPVLKILGDISINGIIKQVVELLPAAVSDLPEETSQTLSKNPAPTPVNPPVPLPSTALSASQPVLTDSTASSSRDSDDDKASSNSTSYETSKDASSEDSEGDETPLESPVNTPNGMSKPSVSSHLLEKRQLLEVDALITSSRPVFASDASKLPSAVASSQSGRKETLAPMSHGQEGFWFLQEYLPDKTVFNTSVMLKLEGDICVETLSQALQMVSRRHEILRTRFFSDDDDGEKKAMQAIAANSALELQTKRITSENEAQVEFAGFNKHVFDLTNGEAARVLLLSLSDTEHFLMAGMHHIYLDGYSFSIFFNDLNTAYTSKRLPPLPSNSQYRSFVQQERERYESGEFEETIAHYRHTLPKDLSPIQLLPFARGTTRREVNNYDQTESKMRIDRRLADKIRQLARNNRSTSFHVFLAAFQALLFQLLPESNDLIIGMGDANRDDKKYLNSIGYFFNLLPLHFSRFKSGTKIADLVQDSRSAVREALERPHVPLSILLDELDVPRSNKHTPLFQVCIDHRQVLQEQSNWGGCRVSDEKWHDAGTGFDISLQITEFNTDASLSLRLQKPMYTEGHTDMLLRSFIAVLEHMADVTTDNMVESIPNWSELDIQRALTVGKDREFNSRWDSNPPTVMHRIHEMITLHGTKTALKDGHGSTLSYEEMGHRISTISAALTEKGIARGHVVGVFQEPSVDWICSMMAIFNIGATYLALDQRLTLPRLATIVETAKPAAILTDGFTSSQVTNIGASAITTVLVSHLASSLNINPVNVARAEDVAVVLFTSGSTGVPKGMRMTHANLVFSTDSISGAFNVTEDSMVLQQSPFSFDPSLCQTLVALTNGAALYVVPSRSRGDPVAVTKIMAEEKVTFTVGTPSEYTMLFEYGADNIRQCHAWRCAAWGGEQMPHGLAKQLEAANLPGLKAHNVYGPSETTMLSHFHLVNPAEIESTGYIPVGAGFGGYKYCIVDHQLRVQPIGVPGEIIIGGPAVVAGYLNNQELTDTKFLADSFFGTNGKVYRSGDLGRMLQDGTLVVEGRLDGDNLVKLRGFRIELEEIEKAIVKQAGGAVGDAIVSLRGEGDAQFLAAHVTLPADLSPPAKQELISALQRLPLSSYMIPSVFGVIKTIPKTAHDKVDRKAAKQLPLPSADDESSLNVHRIDGGDESVLSETERQLGTLWREVIPVYVGSLASTSDFFLAGGNSLLLVKLQALIRAEFGATPKLMDLMGAGNLAAMADAIQREVDSSVTRDGIDWDLETKPPVALQQKLDSFISSVSKNITRRDASRFNILLTGATGQLGRHVLSHLVTNDKATRVICLTRQPDKIVASDKVTTLGGDVSKPKFGLSEREYQQLAMETDVIMHCVANRSFWDRYEVLQPVNVSAVKSLVSLIADSDRIIPLHFMSSGAVSHYYNLGVSPPRDGSDGYVASKWAAEGFLRRVAAETSIPIYIHRPSGVDGDALGSPQERETVTDQLMGIVNSMKIQPEFGGVDGTLDIAPVDDMAQSLAQLVLKSITESADADGSEKNLIHEFKHKAALQVYARDFAARLESEGQHVKFPKMPILEWFGQAKAAGFSYIIAAQELVMTSGPDTLTTRR